MNIPILGTLSFGQIVMYGIISWMVYKVKGGNQQAMLWAGITLIVLSRTAVGPMIESALAPYLSIEGIMQQ